MSDQKTGSSASSTTSGNGTATVGPLTIQGNNETVLISATDATGTYIDIPPSLFDVNNNQTVTIPLIPKIGGTVTGTFTLVDSQSGADINGGTVNIQGKTSPPTNPSGVTMVSGLSPGAAVPFSANFPGYQTFNSTVPIVAGMNFSVKVPMVKQVTGKYYDPRAKRLADAVMAGGYDAEVQALHDINEPGCRDYESGQPCDSVYWTTSDNIPTFKALYDYGYAAQAKLIETHMIGLGALDQTSGIFEHRYEVYLGKAIIRGNPSGGKHGIILDRAYAKILALDTGQPFPNMHAFVSGGGSSGTNSKGKYTVQFDGSTGGGKGTPQTGANFDTQCPQAILAWITGDPLGPSLAQDVMNRVSGTNVTWQVGQALLVGRVYGLDNSAQWKAAEARLWSFQMANGLLPNTLTAGTTSHDPESQDAGLAPYSDTIINNLINLKGKVSPLP